MKIYHNRTTYVDQDGAETEETDAGKVGRTVISGQDIDGVVHFFQELCLEDPSSQMKNFNSHNSEFILDFEDRVERYVVVDEETNETVSGAVAMEIGKKLNLNNLD